MYSKILISYWASMSHMCTFCVGNQVTFNSLYMFSVFPPSPSQSVGKRLICFTMNFQ